LVNGVSQPSEKEEKIEKQRVQVLNSVAAGRLNTMQEKVAWILNHHQEQEIQIFIYKFAIGDNLKAMYLREIQFMSVTTTN